MAKHKIASLEIEEDSTLVDLKGIAPNTILVIASGAAGNIKMLVPKPDTTLNQETITRTAGLCRVFKDGRWQWVPC
jgi:hypothetical protein